MANDIAGYDPAKVLSMTVGYQCVVAEKCGKISFLSILCHPIFFNDVLMIYDERYISNLPVPRFHCLQGRVSLILSIATMKVGEFVSNFHVIPTIVNFPDYNLKADDYRYPIPLLFSFLKIMITLYLF